jgi:hypothetical protein
LQFGTPGPFIGHREKAAGKWVLSPSGLTWRYVGTPADLSARDIYELGSMPRVSHKLRSGVRWHPNCMPNLGSVGNLSSTRPDVFGFRNRIEAGDRTTGMYDRLTCFRGTNKNGRPEKKALFSSRPHKTNPRASEETGGRPRQLQRRRSRRFLQVAPKTAERGHGSKEETFRVIARSC